MDSFRFLLFLLLLFGAISIASATANDTNWHFRISSIHFFICFVNSPFCLLKSLVFMYSSNEIHIIETIQFIYRHKTIMTSVCAAIRMRELSHSSTLCRRRRQRRRRDVVRNQQHDADSWDYVARVGCMVGSTAYSFHSFTARFCPCVVTLFHACAASISRTFNSHGCFAMHRAALSFLTFSQFIVERYLSSNVTAQFAQPTDHSSHSSQLTSSNNKK